MEIFERFNKGILVLPEKEVDFGKIAWSKHPTFEGVELEAYHHGEGHGRKIQLPFGADCTQLQHRKPYP